MYEHEEYPIHTYANVVHDPIKQRWLTTSLTAMPKALFHT